MKDLRKRIGALTAIVLLVGWAVAVGAPMAFARGIGDLSFRWVEAVILKVDIQHRELTLLDFQSGLTAQGLRVAGSVDLREFKVGDYVLARIGQSNRLLLEIRKLLDEK